MKLSRPQSVVLALALVSGVSLGIASAFAFTGPEYGAGVGSGAIGVDVSGDVSVGTSTPNNAARLLIVASSSAPYSFEIMNAAGSPVMTVDNSGNVSGATFAGALNGTLSSGNVSAGQFGSNTGGGNYSFPGSVGVGTAAPITNLQVSQASGNAASGLSTIDSSGHLAGIYLDASGHTTLYNSNASGYSINFAGSGSNGSGGLGPADFASLGVNMFGATQYYGFGGLDTGEQFAFSSANSVNFFANSGYGESFFTNGNHSTPGFVITSSGNVGIGTASPTNPLTVNGATNITGTLTANAATVISGNLDPAAGGNSLLSPYESGNGLILLGINRSGGEDEADFINNVNSYSGGFNFYSLTSSGVTNQLMRIDGSGNVTAAGTITASGFSGPLTGTENAGNVSAGTFGSNTGGGNYTFPSTLTTGGGITVGSGANYLNTGGSLICLSTGGTCASGAATPSIVEDYGVNLIGNAGNQPVRVANASLLVGYGNYGTSYPAGNLLVSGNVGIGTAAPAAKLDVESAATGVMNPTIMVGGNGGNSSITDNSAGTSNYTYFTFAQGGVGEWEMGATGDGASNFYLNPTVQNGSTGAAFFIQHSNSNVGIGTTAPGYRLDVNGTGRFTNTLYANNGVALSPATEFDYWGGGTPYRTWMDNNSTYFYGSVQDYAVHFTMDAEDSGRGWTWGAYGSAPGASLDVNGNLTLRASLTTGGNIVPSTASNSGGSVWDFGASAWGGDGPAVSGITSVTGLTYPGGSGSQLFTLSSSPGQTSLQLDGSIFVGDNGSPYNPMGVAGSSDGYLLVDNGISAGGNLYVNGSINTGTLCLGGTCETSWSGVTAATFTHYFSTSGYEKLPDGLIMQWGYNYPGGGCTTSYYPIAFPNAALNAEASTWQSTDRITYVSAYTASYITVCNNGTGSYADWFVIGY